MSYSGLDEEKEVKQEEKAEIVAFEQKKKPFAYWTIGETEYKLKLKTPEVCRLEEKFKTNLLGVLTGKDIPPLSIMLTVVQAAMQSMNHKVKFTDVQEMFDQYVDEGGTQLTLFTDVIMDILTVSGFFTKNQTANMAERMADVKELL